MSVLVPISKVTEATELVEEALNIIHLQERRIKDLEELTNCQRDLIDLLERKIALQELKMEAMHD